MTTDADDDQSLIIAGGVIGFGLGGLVDVLIFHLVHSISSG